MMKVTAVCLPASLLKGALGHIPTVQMHTFQVQNILYNNHVCIYITNNQVCIIARVDVMNVENKETLTKIISHFMRFFKITDEDDCWRQ